ncbi:hypothetical protein ABS71_05030 [bacterium SCN 62-11]|nr:CBS domain-containing protein [Candidatus Eremiobacteraeota bacterium]ODT74961.1 MAG: hypothetical protein ABS71_05030 [bacterium SCN 62-11]
MIWPHHIPTTPPLPGHEPFPPLQPVQATPELEPIGADLRKHAPYSRDRVGAWMQQPVVTCLLEQTLLELLELLSVHSISGLPVVDAEGGLLGMVSQSDVAAFLSGSEAALSRATVEQIYSPTVHSVGPQATLHEVVELMLREHVHRLPVVQEGRLMGLVSTLDVLRVLRDFRLV